MLTKPLKDIREEFKKKFDITNLGGSNSKERRLFHKYCFENYFLEDEFVRQ